MPTLRWQCRNRHTPPAGFSESVCRPMFPEARLLLSGVNLTLMIGPGVPVPVSFDVLNALTSVQVTCNTNGPSVFQLQFTIDKNSPLLTLFLVASGVQIPLVRVVLYVTMNGSQQVLIDGVITDHQVAPGSGGQSPMITITGEDLTGVMAYLTFTGIPYPVMPPEARVALILLKYMLFGVVPMVIPAIMPDIPIPIDRIPIQNGTDLEYIKQLADEVGYTFFIKPGPIPGQSIAYWGPDIKVGIPQPALNTDMDAYTNVESLSFSFNAANAEIPLVYIQEQYSNVPILIPIPPISPLNPPLGAIPPIPLKFPILKDTAKLSPIQAVMAGLARASKTADAVTATGSLDTFIYSNVFQLRGLGVVRGRGR